jgi:hypothetical protein
MKMAANTVMPCMGSAGRRRVSHVVPTLGFPIR